ncbi:MAG: hypothetical protein KatS3mg032_0163 [Cyclobacteriaceae bacterium]|nr:MAG: hypothetical protein KatS3mg032_0163 [Cyclobacteriaceae bacterium]
MLGVYVAFYLTNRKLENDKRALEKQYIQSMLEDLKMDEQQLTESTDTLKYYQSLLASLANYVHSNRIPGDSASVMIQGLYVYLPFIPRNNTYQTLVSSGSVDVIKDFALRQEIVELYHQHYGAIAVVDRLNEQQRNWLINPYLIRTIQYGSGGKVVNTQTLWSSSQFSNIVSTCYYSLNLKYEYDKAALEKCRSLRSKLEQL